MRFKKKTKRGPESDSDGAWALTALSGSPRGALAVDRTSAA
jgi:hypothetical protein